MIMGHNRLSFMKFERFGLVQTCATVLYENRTVLYENRSVLYESAACFMRMPSSR